eukprot:scaffold234420_cov19-Tisochrysis_lutea.AAC.1
MAAAMPGYAHFPLRHAGCYAWLGTLPHSSCRLLCCCVPGAQCIALQACALMMPCALCMASMTALPRSPWPASHSGV